MEVTANAHTVLEVTTIIGRDSYDNVTGTSCATYSDFSIGLPISSNVEHSSCTAHKNFLSSCTCYGTHFHDPYHDADITINY